MLDEKPKNLPKNKKERKYLRSSTMNEKKPNQNLSKTETSYDSFDLHRNISSPSKFSKSILKNGYSFKNNNEESQISIFDTKMSTSDS